MPRLIVTGPDLPGERTVTCAPGETTIGRSDTHAVVLPAPNVSRHHATIIVEPDGAYLCDAGSENGTALNDL
ncbi:MAG: FHA domain-containing protein, partial [Deltaproteobacteria bacterium]|nr:FHA domain-containing protein [Deltaproteobacteria bacterium]